MIQTYKANNFELYRFKEIETLEKIIGHYGPATKSKFFFVNGYYYHYDNRQAPGTGNNNGILKLKFDKNFDFINEFYSEETYGNNLITNVKYVNEKYYEISYSSSSSIICYNDLLENPINKVVLPNKEAARDMIFYKNYYFILSTISLSGIPVLRRVKALPNGDFDFSLNDVKLYDFQEDFGINISNHTIDLDEHLEIDYTACKLLFRTYIYGELDFLISLNLDNLVTEDTFNSSKPYLFKYITVENQFLRLNIFDSHYFLFKNIYGTGNYTIYIYDSDLNQISKFNTKINKLTPPYAWIYHNFIPYTNLFYSLDETVLGYEPNGGYPKHEVKIFKFE